jgi:hypothetical protein
MKHVLARMGLRRDDVPSLANVLYDGPPPSPCRD